MKTQKEWVQEILRLSELHPDAKIKLLVDSNEVLESGYTAHDIHRVDIDDWYAEDERIFVGEIEILDHLEWCVEENSDSKEELTGQKIILLAQKRYDEAVIEKEIKKVICVYTSP